MIKQLAYIITLFLLCIESGALYALFPMNIFRPYDYNVYPRYTSTYDHVEFSMLSEFGYKAEGRNACGNEVDCFQLWESDQSTLAMIQGFDEQSCNATERSIALFAQKFSMDTDDGTRGHVAFNGDLTLDYNIILSTRWCLPHGFFLGLHIPFLSLSLKNVARTDKTLSRTPDDLFVKQYLTGDLEGIAYRLGNELQLAPWREQGLGDITVIGSWARDFAQAKPVLKNVRIHGDLGLTLPTSKKANPDRLLSIPLGNNGATGLFFGGGMDLLLGRYVRLGFDASFLSLFSHIEPYRVRVAADQPELLLLHKECALKDWGIVEYFNLYAQLYRLADCITARVMYQYVLHDEDTIVLTSGRFSSNTAQTAQSLQGWTIHQFLFTLEYDYDNPESALKPYAAVFYKLPLNGRRSILFDSAGCVIALRY